MKPLEKFTRSFPYLLLVALGAALGVSLSFGHGVLAQRGGATLPLDELRTFTEVQPQLVLLQKTLLNVEGLGRQLYPDLDLWETAKPFLERWMREQIGTRALLREVKRQAPRWGGLLPALPGLAYETLKLARSGEIEVRIRSEELDLVRNEIRRANRRTVLAVIAAALLAGAAVVLALGGAPPAMLWGVPVWSWILGAAGAGLALAARVGGGGR